MREKEQEKPTEKDEDKLLDDIARALILIAKEISKDKADENRIKQ